MQRPAGWRSNRELRGVFPARPLRADLARRELTYRYWYFDRLDRVLLVAIFSHVRVYNHGTPTSLFASTHALFDASLWMSLLIEDNRYWSRAYMP